MELMKGTVLEKNAHFELVSRVFDAEKILITFRKYKNCKDSIRRLAQSLFEEAKLRDKDPIFGAFGVVSHHQKKIKELQSLLGRLNQKLANAQRRLKLVEDGNVGPEDVPDKSDGLVGAFVSQIPATTTNSKATACCHHAVTKLKCSDKDCPLKLFYPQSKRIVYDEVVSLFGAKKVMNNFMSAAEKDRPNLALAIEFEARQRALDPVGGSHAVILSLEDEVGELEKRLNAVQKELQDLGVQNHEDAQQAAVEDPDDDDVESNSKGVLEVEKKHLGFTSGRNSLGVAWNGKGLRNMRGQRGHLQPPPLPEKVQDLVLQNHVDAQQAGVEDPDDGVESNSEGVLEVEKKHLGLTSGWNRKRSRSMRGQLQPPPLPEEVHQPQHQPLAEEGEVEVVEFLSIMRAAVLLLELKNDN